MTTEALQNIIDEAWEKRDQLSPTTGGEVPEAVEAALEGSIRGPTEWPRRWTAPGRCTNG